MNGLAPEQTHTTHQWKYTSPLITCRFDPSGRYVFSSAEDNHVQRWDFLTGELSTLKAHESWVRDLVFLPDGKTVITVGCDQEMIFWPVEGQDQQPIRRVKAHEGWIRCADVDPGGTLIASGGNDRVVRLWNAEDGSEVRSLLGHDSHVYSVMFHPSEPFLLSGDLNGLVIQWDIESGDRVRVFDAKALHSYNTGQKVHYGGVRSLSLSPDGKHLACGGLHKASNPLGAVNEPLIVVFAWDDPEAVVSRVAEGVKGVIWRSRHLSDGRLVGASGGSGGGYLLFWNPDEEKSFHKVKLKDTIRGMDIHDDGISVATAHWDRHLRISRMTAKEAKAPKS